MLSTQSFGTGSPNTASTLLSPPCKPTCIPTLQTYLIVEQDERRVYVYQESLDGSWAMQELIGQGEMPLPCPGRTLTLDEIYDGVL